MKKKLTSVLLFLALSAGVVSAQTSKVTGKVIGEDGEPVIGASIIVKGTTVGTVTDFDGNFELEVPANGKQLVILKSASNLNGNLNCSKELEHYAS